MVSDLVKDVKNVGILFSTVVFCDLGVKDVGILYSSVVSDLGAQCGF